MSEQRSRLEGAFRRLSAPPNLATSPRGRNLRGSHRGGLSRGGPVRTERGRGSGGQASGQRSRDTSPVHMRETRSSRGRSRSGRLNGGSSQRRRAGEVVADEDGHAGDNHGNVEPPEVPLQQDEHEADGDIDEAEQLNDQHETENAANEENGVNGASGDRIEQKGNRPPGLVPLIPVQQPSNQVFAGSLGFGRLPPGYGAWYGEYGFHQAAFYGPPFDYDFDDEEEEHGYQQDIRCRARCHHFRQENQPVVAQNRQDRERPSYDALAGQVYTGAQQPPVQSQHMSMVAHHHHHGLPPPQQDVTTQSHNCQQNQQPLPHCSQQLASSVPQSTVPAQNYAKQHEMPPPQPPQPPQPSSSLPHDQQVEYYAHHPTFPPQTNNPHQQQLLLPSPLHPQTQQTSFHTRSAGGFQQSTLPPSSIFQPSTSQGQSELYHDVYQPELQQQQRADSEFYSNKQTMDQQQYSQSGSQGQVTYDEYNYEDAQYSESGHMQYPRSGRGRGQNWKKLRNKNFLSGFEKKQTTKKLQNLIEKKVKKEIEKAFGSSTQAQTPVIPTFTAPYLSQAAAPMYPPNTAPVYPQAVTPMYSQAGAPALGPGSSFPPAPSPYYSNYPGYPNTPRYY